MAYIPEYNILTNPSHDGNIYAPKSLLSREMLTFASFRRAILRIERKNQLT